MNFEIQKLPSLTIDYSETSSYEYNASGYPISIKKVIKEDGSVDTFDYILTYNEIRN
jgi:hypothetical protein